MYTNNSMSNNNIINKFYRPATWESICFNDPEKAALLDSYFEKIGWYPRKNGVPTVNLTYGIISPSVIHTKIWYDGQTTEYLHITESCKTGGKVTIKRTSVFNENINLINNCRFAYAADVPTPILKEFIDKTVCWEYPLYQYKKVLERKDSIDNATQKMEELKKENQALKEELNSFKKSIENLYNMTTK